MDTFRCNSCGFETENKSHFIRTQGNGDQHWLEMACPQCVLLNPPVALVGESPFKNEPKWGLEETNYGLYVWHVGNSGARSSSPMIPVHQLANAPASLLPGGEIVASGTLWDVHQRLMTDGKARHAAFHNEVKAIDAKYPRPETAYEKDLSLEARLAEVDAARMRNHVGPHDQRVTHDGPSLMRKMPRGRWVKVA